MRFAALRRTCALALLASAPVLPIAAQSAPPGTDVFLVPVHAEAGRVTVGAPVNLTGRPGYDNQPAFTPDGTALWYTMIGADGHADICRVTLDRRVTDCRRTTPESEYSPGERGDGSVVVVRVEADSTQRLWQFPPGAAEPVLLLRDLAPVGYYAWLDATRVVCFVLGTPPTLQLADTRGGPAVVLATDIGRSLQRIPDGTAVSFLQRDTDGWAVRRYQAADGQLATITRALPGSDFHAWLPDGTLLMARGDALYRWRQGLPGWQLVAAFGSDGLRGITRLAVSPDGRWLALVADDPGP